MSAGYDESPVCVFSVSKGHTGLLYHISVGIWVARFTVKGSAKALDSGTSDRQDSHAFFLYRGELCPLHLLCLLGDR